MGRAVVYLRVSTDEQAESGLGLEAQEAAGRAWAAKQGVEVLAVRADEGVSGTAPLERRPALLAAVADLARGDVLVVAKRDRLGRDMIVVAMIEAAVHRRGARVVSTAGEGTTGETATDLLMRRLIDAFAEYERLVIVARTRAALDAKRRRGERVGGVPYGYDLASDGRTLVESPVEQLHLQRIAALAPGLSLRELARRLDDLGIPPKRGGRWSTSSLAKILRRLPCPHSASTSC